MQPGAYSRSFTQGCGFVAPADGQSCTKRCSGIIMYGKYLQCTAAAGLKEGSEKSKYPKYEKNQVKISSKPFAAYQMFPHFLKRKLIYVCGRNQPIWPWIEPDCMCTHIRHKCRRRRLLSWTWNANCICRQNKVGRVVGADLARAEGRWFGLSNTFINYDESPLQFTSNQRPLTVTQHWSPLL